MPLFFFDIIDNGDVTRDAFGIDLEDYEEVRQQAQALLPDIARRALPDGEAHSFVCEVRDEGARIVYRGTLTYRGERLATRPD